MKSVNNGIKKKMGMSNRIFHIFNTVFWIIAMFIILYPLYLVLIASVSDPDAITRGEVIWHPVDFSLMGYQAVFRYNEMLRSYGNSILYTLLSTVISIFVTLGAAYALSRPKFPGKRFFNFLFIFTMFFNGGLVPTFLVMRDIGLYNNPAVIILMSVRKCLEPDGGKNIYPGQYSYGIKRSSHAGRCIPFSVFFQDYSAAGQDNHCGTDYLLWSVKWTDYFTGMVYLRDRSLLPLQTVLREILATLQVDTSSDYMMTMSDNAASLTEAMRIANAAKYCIIVVSTGPVIILYAFLQKYFEKGVMIGSLKG